MLGASHHFGHPSYASLKQSLGHLPYARVSSTHRTLIINYVACLDMFWLLCGQVGLIDVRLDCNILDRRTEDVWDVAGRHAKHKTSPDLNWFLSHLSLHILRPYCDREGAARENAKQALDGRTFCRVSCFAALQLFVKRMPSQPFAVAYGRDAKLFKVTTCEQKRACASALPSETGQELADANKNGFGGLGFPAPPLTFQRTPCASNAHGMARPCGAHVPQTPELDTEGALARPGDRGQTGPCDRSERCRE